MNFLMNLALSFSRLLANNATQTQKDTAKVVDEILSVWVGPFMTALGAVGAIYVIILGIQYAKSENDSKRAEAKTRMVNCIIGVLSLIVIGVVCWAVNWVEIAQIFGYAREGFDPNDIVIKPVLRLLGR